VLPDGWADVRSLSAEQRDRLQRAEDSFPPLAKGVELFRENPASTFLAADFRDLRSFLNILVLPAPPGFTLTDLREQFVSRLVRTAVGRAEVRSVRFAAGPALYVRSCHRLTGQIYCARQYLFVHRRMTVFMIFTSGSARTSRLSEDAKAIAASLAF
jgi:hypothetical protein